MGIRGIFLFILIVMFLIIMYFPQLEYWYFKLLIHFGFKKDPFEEEKENIDNE